MQGVATYSHGRREATKNVAEAAGLAPGRHLGAHEDNVHAVGGAHDDGVEPPAPTVHPPLLLGSCTRAGPHAERVHRVPGPQALETMPKHRGCRPVGDAEAGARDGELGCGQSRHGAQG